MKSAAHPSLGQIFFSLFSQRFKQMWNEDSTKIILNSISPTYVRIYRITARTKSYPIHLH